MRALGVEQVKLAAAHAQPNHLLALPEVATGGRAYDGGDTLSMNAKTESDGDVCRVLVSSSAINRNRNHSARRDTMRATHPYCPGGKPVVVRDPSIIPLTTATWGVQCSGVPIPRLRFAR